MAFVFRGRAISKVGVIGSGQIGPDIALHFVKVLHPYGVQVIVVDVADDALERGKASSSKRSTKAPRAARSNPRRWRG